MGSSTGSTVLGSSGADAVRLGVSNESGVLLRALGGAAAARSSAVRLTIELMTAI